MKSVEAKFKVEGRSNLLEVIVPNNSDLIGRPLKKTNFRERYDAAIIGVQREGKPLKGKIGRIVLQVGDLLLLATGGSFHQKNAKEQTFIIETHARKSHSKLKRKVLFTWFNHYYSFGNIIKMDFITNLGCNTY